MEALYLAENAKKRKGYPMNKVARKIEKFFSTFIPDAFPLSFVLMVVCMAMAKILTQSSLSEILGITSYGMVSLWSFTIQIVTVMVLGYCVACAPPVERLLGKIARSLGENPIRVIFLTGIICNIIQYINSNVGMIAAAVIAREVIKNNRHVRPGIVVAVSYSGMCVHCLGLSPAIFSTVATAGHAFEEHIGIIPFSETTFFIPNIIISIVLGIGIPFVMAVVHPKDFVNPLYDPQSETTHLEVEAESVTPVEDNSDVLEFKRSKFVRFFEDSKIFSWIIGIVLLIGLVFWFKLFDGSLNFDTITVLLFGLALVLWGSLERMANCAADGVRSMYAVVISFPIYAAIMKIMTDTGLASVISNFIVSNSSKDSLPVLSFWAAGFINIFVPSAGGQWVVQAPTLVSAATALGTSYNKIVTAVALGDCWTNMIQPFWALPILGITKVKCREMIAFTAVICLFEGIAVSLIMAFVYTMF